VRAWSRLALAALLAAGAACSQAGLPHAEASGDALARAVLTALHDRDVDRLRALALTESEFRDVVWPELPAARPERNLTADYVWADLHAKSEAGLRRVVADHGGQALTFVRLDVAGETTQYRSYVVRRDAVIVARDGEGERRLRLFGSIIERGGGVKVFSYIAD
jgi:hypothetical protein